MQVLLISLIIGVAIGFVVVSVLKGQLRSVHRQSGASGYLTEGSLVLRIRQDRYLYENTTRTPKPKSNKN